MTFPRFRRHPIVHSWRGFSEVCLYLLGRENAATAFYAHPFLPDLTGTSGSSAWSLLLLPLLSNVDYAVPTPTRVNLPGVSQYQPLRENVTTARYEHGFLNLFDRLAAQLAFRALLSSNSTGGTYPNVECSLSRL